MERPLHVLISRMVSLLRLYILVVKEKMKVNISFLHHREGLLASQSAHRNQSAVPFCASTPGTQVFFHSHTEDP